MSWITDFIELIFPRTCCVCGTPLVGGETAICSRCLLSTATADNTLHQDNIVELRLAGRVNIEASMALLYFKKNTTTQQILHQIKYQNNKELAHSMGLMMGDSLLGSGRFGDIDLVIPVPLHRSKERRRGYNQSLLLSKAIAEKTRWPVVDNVLIRKKKTDSQTHKTREQRLENMQGVFALTDASMVENKHILLVDDVVTTGATLEACCQALQNATNVRISVAALAVAGDT